MGNQPSKGSGAISPRASRSLTPSTDNLQQYPTISKADTKESTRSFRSLRTKSRDSPRTSGILSNGGSPPNDRTDAASVKSGKSSRSALSRASVSELKNSSTTDIVPISHLSSEDVSTTVTEMPQQPPSPVMSPSMINAHHDVDAAKRSGEVDMVSDQPLSGTTKPYSAAVAAPLESSGDSILVKRPTLVQSRLSNDVASTLGKFTMSMADMRESDVDEYIKRLLDAGYDGKQTKGICLKNAEITSICSRVRELLLEQPPLIEIDAPVKIVGDIHGQYSDLIRMFEMCGFPPNSNYLFLGDYVDRGKQSLETILLLLCYKIKYPENFFLLRGNHECANVTRVYGFYDECKRRTNVKIWKSFIDTFNCLPIAAIVAGKIFCVHGGLSPALMHMDDIRNIMRPTDVPDFGLLNDLLWSDPAKQTKDWEQSERGVSYSFGKKVITDFLTRHDFDLVCRAHMVVEDGYEFFEDRILVTVFSAPNYCGEFDNYGAVMSVSTELLCSFELIKPLDTTALKNQMKKSRNKRNMMNSPPASTLAQSV